MRFDEFLIKHKLATPTQVQEALEYQRSHGDRLETHLFRFGYVGEPALIKALSEQFCYPGVLLSGREIPEATLQLMAPESVLEYQAMPFHYEAATGEVRVACENPRQGSLRENLARLLPGKTIELYIALGVTLRLAILKHYRQSVSEDAAADASESERPGLEIAGLTPEAPAAPESRQVPTVSRTPVSDAATSQPTAPTSAAQACRLLLFDTADDDLPTLGQILLYQGYQVATVRTAEEFLKAAAESKPHIQVLQIPGDRSAVTAILRSLVGNQASITECPSFLIMDEPSPDEVNDLLQVGFEDVIDSENVLDLMMIRLKRVRERLLKERSRRQDFIEQLGTHGSLGDMNVIDLLQAMGPTGKTARLSVTGFGQQLTVWLDQGRIIFAECDGVIGAEAVFCALGWKQGVWSLDPVEPDSLPEPNNHLTNEAILLEGCRRLDEGVRDASSASVDDLLSSLDQFG